jgi:hypothetical protein
LIQTSDSMRFSTFTWLSIRVFKRLETKTICDLPYLIRFAFEEDVRTRFLDKDGEIRLSRRGVGVAGKVWMTRGRVKLIRLF